MFEPQRHIVSLQLRDGVENVAIFERGIKYITDSGWMTFSSVLQQIGVQALVAAATMGLAGVVAKAAFMTTAADSVMGIGAEGGLARAAVAGVARVGGISSGTAGSVAMRGILSRATAGLLILTARRLTSDLGTKAAGTPPPNNMDLAVALFSTVLVAWAGSPAAPSTPVQPIKSLIDLLPTASTQVGAQAGMLNQAALSALMRDPASRPLFEFIKANRGVFDQKVERTATMTAQSVVDSALKAQPDLLSQVETAAKQQDYSEYLPMAARHGDNRTQLNEMCVKMAIYQFKTDFWLGVARSLDDLERAMNQEKHIPIP